ncbi:hypothetical protein Unana1_02964 [Umbelopsis nana]
MLAPAFWALDPLFRSHAKIFTADIHKLKHIPEHSEQYPDLYQYDARTISNVEITGTVVGVEQTHHMVIYTVDDGFGTITCCHWTTSSYSAPEIGLGDCVRVLGRINEYKEQKQVNVHEIYVHADRESATEHHAVTKDQIEDYNTEVFHWLQTIRLRESVYSKPFEIPSEIIEKQEELEVMLKSPEQDTLPEQDNDVQASIAIGSSGVYVVSGNVMQNVDKMDIVDQEMLQNAVYQYLQDLAVDGKLAYSEVRKSVTIQAMVKKFLDNTIPPSQINSTKIKTTIRQCFDGLCHNGLIFVIDEENDIYEVVHLAGNLRELILQIIQEADSDYHDIDHGGITGNYIIIKVHEDSRFKSMHSSKIHQALQLLVLDSVIYQVNAQEYKITR